MLKIYHIEARRSERIVWLCEELGMEYELIFKPGDVPGSWETIKQVHPMGLAPTIQDGDVVICESGAILQYILAKYGNGKLAPSPTSPDFPYYLEWLHFSEATFANRITTENWLQPKPGSFMEMAYPAVMVGVTDKMLNWINDILSAKQFIAGNEFTAADIMMPISLRLLELVEVNLKDYPHVAAYFERLTSRPAFVRTLEVCQPLGPPPF